MQKQYLHQGVCIAQCPEGYREEGTGWKDRLCVRDINAGTTTASAAPTTTTTTVTTTTTTVTSETTAPQCIEGENACYRCKDATRCRKCKSRRYLHKGECLRACPDGYTEEGTGWRGRRCKRVTTSTTTTETPTDTPSTAASVGVAVAMCERNENSCRRCASVTMCGQCKNYHYLHNGICVARCPVGFVGEGSGHKGRRCRRLQSADANVGGSCAHVAGCSTCFAGMCVQCEGAYTLHQGACVASCPETRLEVGGGGQDDSNRVCFRPPESLVVRTPMVSSAIPECQAGKKGCKRCRGGVCLQCKPWRTLLDGACVSACPTDAVEAGSDNTVNRVCL